MRPLGISAKSLTALEKMQTTHRRISKGAGKAKLGGTGNGSKLVEGCMKGHAIRNEAQSELFPHSSCQYNN